MKKGETGPRRGNGEGSIWHDEARNRYVGQLPPDPATGKRKRVTAKTRTECAKKYEEELRKLRDHGSVALGNATVEVYLREWVKGLSVRSTTLESYELNVEKRLIPHLGKLKLNKLTSLHVKRMADAVAKETSPSTANQARRVLRKAINDAKEHRIFVGDNPVTRSTSLPPNRREVTLLDVEDLLRLYKHLNEVDLDVALVHFAAETIARQGEVLGLRWTDLRLDGDDPRALLQVQLLMKKGPKDPQTGRRVTTFELVDLKTEKSRRVLSLNPELVAALKKHKAAQAARALALGPQWQNKLGLVFTGPMGEPLSRNAVTLKFQRALKRAGLPKVRFHDLRHGGISLLAERGVDTKVIADAAGHSSTQMVLTVYQHVKKKTVADAFAKLRDLAPR